MALSLRFFTSITASVSYIMSYPGLPWIWHFPSISTDAYRVYIIAAKFSQNTAVQERPLLPSKKTWRRHFHNW